MTPAIRAAERAGIAHRVLSYEHDPRAAAYGPEAARYQGSAYYHEFAEPNGAAGDRIASMTA